MNRSDTTTNVARWMQVLFAALLIIAFFIPWVSWDNSNVSGAAMPKGDFFRISEAGFGLANPFPQMNILVIGLWAIPLFAALSILLALFNKKTPLVAAITGVLALSLATMYILFTNVLIDLGAGYAYQIGIYITILAGIGIILVGSQPKVARIGLVLLGPLATFIGFMAASKQLENEKFEDTSNTLSAYTVNVIDLIREFHANDSLANARYREKILTVNGNISEIETPNDSTINIKFIDTTGSYAIFPFHDEQLADVKKLKNGDSISIKASCSGGVLSEILGIESVTFKRCTLNK